MQDFSGFAGATARTSEPVQTPVPAYLVTTLFTVADQGSVTKAATFMGVPHAMVSHQLARLESMVGTSLFTTDHGRFRLTDLGRQLVAATGPAVQQIQRASQDALRRSSSVAAPRVGRPTLTVELGVWGIAAALRPRMDALRSLECGFNFVMPQRSVATPDVICHLGKTPQPGYETTVLFSEEVVAVAGGNYAIPEDGIDPDDLPKHPLLSLSHPDHKTDWAAFLGRDPDAPLPGLHKAPFDNFNLYIKTIAAGRGIGVGMAPLFQDAINRGQLKLASNRRLWRNRACFLGVREDSTNKETAQKFAVMLREIFSPATS